MSKLAIVIGHTEDSQGACSPHNISCEWEFMFGVGAELVIRDKADIFLYDTYKGGYTNMVMRNARELNKKKYDLILELHYNGSSNAQANGAEALYYHKPEETDKEERLAKYFVSRWEEISSIRSRGAKRIHSSKERGYAAVYHPIGNCLILEPFFGTNFGDVEKMKEHYWNFIDLIEELSEL